MIVGGLSLYLLAPKLISVLASWPQLKTLKPGWFGLALLFESMSYLSLWSMQRVALHATSWFAVGTTQLASGAVGSVVPGGAATAGAFAYRMLIQAGVRSEDVASGLAASTIASTAALFAMPLLALPAILGGLAAPHGLIATLYVGVAGFVAVAVLSAAAFGWDAPLLIAGRGGRWLIQRARHDQAADLPERLITQRDRMKSTFGRRWPAALTGAVGKVGFDYAALVCCLAAVGARPHPSLVLLAYIAAALLALIPITPGGLGFVEAGLTGMLTAAGVGAQQALVSTLAYRLASFWLPIPAGGVAYLLFRRRYGPEPEESSTSTTVP
ncbi:MAG TPA: lysylphosphatidylglycerol synthase transmembrane domain-containing protein [Solirubrobacteraceae bacterium]